MPAVSTVMYLLFLSLSRLVFEGLLFPFFNRTRAVQAPGSLQSGRQPRSSTLGLEVDTREGGMFGFGTLPLHIYICFRG